MNKAGLLFFLTAATWFACDDTGYSELVGKWQLKTVELNGSTAQVDTVWYNFQSKSVFSLQVYVPHCDTFLTVLGFRKQENRTLNILVSSIGLEYFDWTDYRRSFVIEKIDGKQLILRGEDNGACYSFIKF